jgi:hypothetical protein
MREAIALVILAVLACGVAAFAAAVLRRRLQEREYRRGHGTYPTRGRR